MDFITVDEFKKITGYGEIVENPDNEYGENMIPIPNGIPPELLENEMIFDYRYEDGEFKI